MWPNVNFSIRISVSFPDHTLAENRR
jgi:hypothetical protein